MSEYRFTTGFGVGLQGIGQVIAFEVPTYTVPAIDSDKYLYSAIGNGQAFTRPWSAPYLFIRRNTEDPEFASALDSLSVTFHTMKGVYVGTLFFGASETIINSFKGTMIRGNCREGVLELLRMPDFTLPGNVIVTIKGPTQNIYKGKARVIPPKSVDRDLVQIKLIGLWDQLANIKEDVTIDDGQDYGEAVDGFIFDYGVEPATNIGYNTGKIDTDVGLVLASDVDLSKNPMSKVLEAFAGAGDCDVGVDADGDFFYKKISETILDTFFLGTTFKDYELRDYPDKQVNHVTVRRQTQSGSTKAGWAVAAVRNDIDSINNTELKSKVVQVPGYFDDDFCEGYADRIIARLKDVPMGVIIKRHPMRSIDDILPRGKYRFISEFDSYTELFDGCNSTSAWTKYGAGDLAVTLNTAAYLEGSGAIQLQWTSALNDYAVFDFGSRLNRRFEKIRVHLRASSTSTQIRIGVGASSWNEETFEPKFRVSAAYDYFEFEVDLKKIRYFGVEILDNSSGVVLIDLIEYIHFGTQMHDLFVTKQEVDISPSSGGMIAYEFGEMSERTEDMIADIIELAKTADSSGEIR